MPKKTALVIGGDERQYFLSQALAKAGYLVTYYVEPQFGKVKEKVDEKAIATAMTNKEIIVLPIANPDMILNAIIKYATVQQRIYGGMFDEKFCAKCKKAGVMYFDYMKNNVVAIRNAVATAEGAIVEAIINSNINLHGSKSLVVGLGRCGEILAEKLAGFKSNVIVMVRRPEAKAKAEAYGYHVLYYNEKDNVCYNMDGEYNHYDYIFNTAPVKLIDETFLEQINHDVVIIDIASSPGGVDYEYCNKKNIKAKSCLSLPGKYAPKTSGEILAEAIIEQEES